MISAKKAVNETQDYIQSHQRVKKNLEKKMKAVALNKINTICLISAMLLKGTASRGNRHFPSQICYMPGGEVHVYALKLKNTPI